MIPDGDIMHANAPLVYGNVVPYRVRALCGKTWSPDDFPPLFRRNLEDDDDKITCPECREKLGD